jgi:hypothetical protein
MNGLVGVYFADQAMHVDGGEAHFFCQVEYDDINRTNDNVVKVPVQHPPGKVQSLLGNAVHFKGMVVADFGQPKIWGQEADDFQVAHFKPAGLQAGKWREIVVEVRKDRIHAFFDRGSYGAHPLTAHERCLTDHFAQVLQQQPVKCAFYGAAAPTFHRHGGLGIFVRQGSAAFARVSIEPLNTGEE